MVSEFVSSFSSRPYPSVLCVKMYRLLWMNTSMSTNMALKTRARCHSFDQSVRTCNYRLVVNMMNQNGVTFPDGVISTAMFLLQCVKHLAHRNSKSRVYSGPPTRSYTAAAAGVAVRCCCCCGLGTRTHTKTVPLASRWGSDPIPGDDFVRH